MSIFSGICWTILRSIIFVIKVSKGDLNEGNAGDNISRNIAWKPVERGERQKSTDLRKLPNPKHYKLKEFYTQVPYNQTAD